MGRGEGEDGWEEEGFDVYTSRKVHTHIVESFYSFSTPEIRTYSKRNKTDTV